MQTLLFLHGAGAQGPGEGSSALLAALRQALPEGMVLAAPLMPEPDNPQPELWLPELARAMEAQGEPFVVVGHSLGGSSLLQHLAAHGVPEKLVGVVLLAVPFWGMPDWDFDGWQAYGLPDGAGARLRALRQVTILRGDADDTVPQSHVERYRSVLPQAEAHLLRGIDHEAAGAAEAVVRAVEAQFDRA